jgi:DNA ligase-1
MRAFSQLLDDLVYTRSRNTKLKLIGDYLRETADPDRGFGLAALTGTLDIPAVKHAAVRAIAEERVDPVLLYMSRDYVGDMAETVALLWPTSADGVPETDDATIRISDAIERLRSASRMDAPRVLAAMLDHLDASGRFALLKLATGELRVGVNARLAKQAFADAFGLQVEAVEEVWHGLRPPFPELFAWAEGGEQPMARDVPVFRPFMLAHPLEETRVSLDDFAAEWKWDGIRVQLVHTGEQTRIYSRTGDDISQSFPDIAEAFRTEGVLDGELLVRGEDQGIADVHGGAAASFNALQQRLGRKIVSQKMLNAYPAFVRLYDILFDRDEDLRELSWSDRRQRLESFAAQLDPDRFDISQLITARSFEELEDLRLNARDVSIEGIMLKRRDSPYVGGRRSGLWYKWKRDPLTADCVLMYAARGSGKRSSYYSDYTFGCWAGDPASGAELLPVGKAYFGFTDEELKWLDRWIRAHTVQRFGPVREVEKALVLEVAFDSIHKSTRHKSGLAMRFPRVSRIRTDKPANEADQISTLQSLVT